MYPVTRTIVAHDNASVAGYLLTRLSTNPSVLEWQYKVYIGIHITSWTFFGRSIFCGTFDTPARIPRDTPR